jgi:hypothetical protein
MQSYGICKKDATDLSMHSFFYDSDVIKYNDPN